MTETFDLDYLQSDGILGLAPIDGLAKSVPGKSSFVQNLYDQGVIKNRVFSFFLASYNDFSKESAFTLGGYDLDQYAPNSTVTWNAIQNTNYWTVLLTGASFGSSPITL